MSALAQVPNKPFSWQVTVGAEGIAAAQFARCGFNVSVQSGREKPWYDLVVAKASNLLKVSIRGSEDGSWALLDPFLNRAGGLRGKLENCRAAINLWLDHHGSRAMCCLVQFQGVPIGDLPRIYLASPLEVAEKLLETAERLGSSALYEKYEWAAAGDGSPTIETLPSAWAFSEMRIQELLTNASSPADKPMLLPQSIPAYGAWSSPLTALTA